MQPAASNLFPSCTSQQPAPKPTKKELVVINGLAFCRAWRTDFPVLYECAVGQEYVLLARLLSPHRPYSRPDWFDLTSGPRGLSVPGSESLVSAARLVRRRRQLRAHGRHVSGDG
jgi:hypothetical protein